MRWALWAAGAAWTLAAVAQAPAAVAAELFAERIPADGARRVGGPDAIAGVGDWALGNGVICAAVADPAHETVLDTAGGVLVDLGHCGRGDDRFVQLQPLFNLSQEAIPPVAEIRPEVDAQEARLVTSGKLGRIAFETSYAVDLVRPRILRVRTRIRGAEDAERVFLFGDVLLHGRGSLAAFTANLVFPDRSLGFAHPVVDHNSRLSMVRGLRDADLHVLVAVEEDAPGIAYGVRLAGARFEDEDEPARPVPVLALNGEDFSLLGVFANPLWLGGGGRLGFLELLQTLFMGLGEEEGLVVEREIAVGERGDVASVTDLLWADAPRVHGRVDDPAARLEVRRAAGAPATWVRPEPDGSFAFRVPSGEYALAARSGDGRVTELAFRVEDADVALEPLALVAPARVRLPRAGPMRLVFRGTGGTPDPTLRDDGIDLRFGALSVSSSEESADVSLAGRPGDPEEIVLAPGSYRVYATRGPEFDVREAPLEAVAGQTVELAIESPARVFSTPGWIAADLHVHAEPSDDSALPLRRRLASFAAQGAEVLVATDHDVVTDYRPLVQEMALAGEIASVVGVELTSTVRGARNPFTSGHANAFPLARDPLAYRGGAPAHEGLRLRDSIASLRARGGVRLFQLNHPRGGGSLNFFDHLSVAGEPFDPTRPLGDARNRALAERDPETGLRDLDFDAVELMNGKRMEQYRVVRADWLSLLLQGEVRAATANSDSHVALEPVALPRSYVRVDDDRPEAFDEAAFVAAVRAGRLVGTTGPLLEADLGGAGPGERFSGAQGELRARVRAAPWVPVSQLRVYVNGALVEESEISTSGELRLSLGFAGDAFVTLEVEGTPGEVYAAVAPGFTPFAFTNPIFVDADADGTWTAPGLASPLPPTIARRADR